MKKIRRRPRKDTDEDSPLFRLYQELLWITDKKERAKFYMRTGPKKLRRIQAVADYRSRLLIQPDFVKKNLQKTAREINKFFKYMKKKGRKK